MFAFMKNSPLAKSETPQIGKNPKRRERKKNAQGRSFSIDVPFYRGRVRKRGRIKKVKREEEKKKKKKGKSGGMRRLVFVEGISHICLCRPCIRRKRPAQPREKWRISRWRFSQMVIQSGGRSTGENKPGAEDEEKRLVIPRESRQPLFFFPALFPLFFLFASYHSCIPIASRPCPPPPLKEKLRGGG
jgi:hypothetical protein